MVETTVNLFDLFVIGLIGISALIAFFRGFIREVLSLGAWVGASIITIYAFPDVAVMLKPHVNSTVIASGFAAMGTFMGSLLLIGLFSAILLRYVRRGSDIGLLDNGLGLLFGAARGALLISLGYFVMSLVLREEDYPEWIQAAYTKSFVESGAVWVAKLAPEYLEEISPLSKEIVEHSELDSDAPMDEKIADTITPAIGKTEEALPDALPSDGALETYEWMNIEELEKLIDSSGKGANAQ